MVRIVAVSAVFFVLPALVSASGGLAFFDVETGDRHDRAGGIIVAAPSAVTVSALIAH